MLNVVQISFLGILIFLTGFTSGKIEVSEHQYQLPVLKGKYDNPILRIKLSNVKAGQQISEMRLGTQGVSDLADIKAARLYYYGQDSLPGNKDMSQANLFSSVAQIQDELVFQGNQVLNAGDNYFWLSYELTDQVDLSGFVDAQLESVQIDQQRIDVEFPNNDIKQRVGVALRKPNQDGVHTSRIPGLATTNKGTLIALFDARYESARDLQGNMDIGIHRSEDDGNTWEPIQIAMDMGQWGGLPEKFNGVSDACVLVDKHSGAIYIAGLWMHGVIDDQGRWLENLNEESDAWNHQWRTKGSQPGFGVKETAQFLIVKSTDDGKTWSEPVNITQMGKKKEWWLWAPAPGQGITLKDGTLVFPSQGRDEHGKAFSNLTYSTDGGKVWQSSNPALNESTTECMAVERSDGSVMLNMRANSNKKRTDDSNGRAVAVTKDLGKQWTEHATSHDGLIEPVCMGSIIRHDYQKNGKDASVLLFSNPNSKTTRHKMTIKYSHDDGMNWSTSSSLLLDEFKGRGYSCLTSIDDNTVGILYESSQADMVYQQVELDEFLH